MQILNHPTPTFTNAHINRREAMRMARAGFTAKDIAEAFPEVWKLVKGQYLSQKYDSKYADSELLETRYTMASHVVDEMIAERES